MNCRYCAWRKTVPAIAKNNMDNETLPALLDRLDRLVEAVEIAQRTRSIAIQSIWMGMGLSLVAMGGATLGLLSPVLGAVAQEAIDAAAILNALSPLFASIFAAAKSSASTAAVTFAIATSPFCVFT